jgi:hypothetical protein
MSEHIDQERRRFLSTAAAVVATAQLGLNHSANSQPGNAQSQLPPINPGKSAGPLRQDRRGEEALRPVAFHAQGPRQGRDLPTL